MKSKKQLIKIFAILTIIIAMMQTTVFASNLTLKTTVDKENYGVNDKVTVTIDWEEKMQAASFTIKYDADKLQLESADIGETYYNATTKGEISINWVSLEEKDLTKMNFVFKCIKVGDANIGIKEVSAFANGDMVSPTGYDFVTFGNKNIIIKDSKQQGVQEEKNPEEDKKTEEDKKPEVEQVAPKEENPSKDETIINGDIPKAGKESLIIFMILSISIISVIAMKKTKALSDI